MRSCPKLLFTSSLAVFGAIDVATDASACQPSSSYGTQKALGELLVNDYSRKGFVDGRTLRLPTACQTHPSCYPIRMYPACNPVHAAMK